MKQKLEEQEETALNIAETYNSLQQEVEVKTKKLKKVKHVAVHCVTVKLSSILLPGSKVSKYTLA